MTDYGVFATLVATVSSLVAATAAIALGFQRRARWQPPEEAVPSGVSRVASLLTAVAIAILYVFSPRLSSVALASAAAILFILTLGALLAAISVNIHHSYYYPKPGEKYRKLGGDALTAEATRVQKDHGVDPQQMFLDAQGRKDLVWTRASQASVAIRSTLSFIFLIAGGGSCLATAGMLVATAVRG